MADGGQGVQNSAACTNARDDGSWSACAFAMPGSQAVDASVADDVDKRRSRTGGAGRCRLPYVVSCRRLRGGPDGLVPGPLRADSEPRLRCKNKP